MMTTSKREAKLSLTLAWDECRPEILSSIAETLNERLPQQWVNVTSVLPQGLPTRSWRSMWKKSMEIGLRLTEYVPVEGYYLLRHKFGNSFYLWCVSRREYSGDLDTLVSIAMRKSPKGSIPGITQIQDMIDDKCVDYVEQLNDARLCVENIDKIPSPARKRKLDQESLDTVTSSKKRSRKQSCSSPKGPLAFLQSSGTEHEFVSPPALANDFEAMWQKENVKSNSVTPEGKDRNTGAIDLLLLASKC